MHTYHIIEKGRPLHEANKALILLHGRGSTADDILTLSNEFCDDTFYIAASQATGNTWYPYSFLVDESQNEPWLSSAVEVVKRLIDETSQHIPVHQIYLMGFSQGACLTLEVAARYAQQYAGVVAFTGGLIGKQLAPEKYKGDFRKAKVYIGNSDIDPHVPVIRSKESKKIMESLGADVTLDVFPGMAHTVSVKEINRVKELMF
ncbi:alpha/beta hydrolase [Lacibacter sediminis]|uniref:Dienelactone hydrolase family protein n=1 Tax=Lacibacter sediminis TaxID=2760713 RepID=A0A7G5XKC2_9BACT|nr:dienelactone hydrolase family protein [Lacibacter sediminis]QNA45925.1 dienelactone hydrolase family protein [Lacibacter sediminis]